jgi:hypothetical protein
VDAVARSIAWHLDLALAWYALGAPAWRQMAEGAAFVADGAAMGSADECRAALETLAGYCSRAVRAEPGAGAALLQEARTALEQVAAAGTRTEAHGD